MMRTAIKLSLSIFITLFVLAGCEEKDLTGDLLKPWQAPDIKLTSDVTVGVYYNMSQRDTDWLNIDPLYVPTLGKYNSDDAQVIKQHLDWSVLSGIDLWLCDVNSDSIIKNVFPSVPGIDQIKIAFTMSLSSLGKSSTITDSATIVKIVAGFDSVQSIFDLPNYLKVDGKPVVILEGAYNYSPRPTYAGSDTIDKRVAGLAKLRVKLKEATDYDYFFIGNYVGWFPPERYPKYIKAFDAVTANMFTNQKQINKSYYENIDLEYEHWKTYLDQNSVQFVPSIFPGINDTITGTSNDVTPRSEAFFSDGCEVGKKYMDNTLRFIFINSFNNWTSGTQVEPAVSYGTAYLDIIKNKFKVNQ